ncbi:hypothetical protein IR148_00955 [Dysgonomonas mossii]|uniref:Homeodomain phBC6A51-type domain-containing protein n=1 Tax=Dysgonomonas mossii TaxID=163665 RepID=A0A4Y9IQS6_9BACT|nr:hypothetical protein [Dysgonomonas mossii]MBF0759612.1 hypothetical protein [Dysgonomonas mossii]TFU90576.1 hypothetical protein E4T88_00950 [Dysgonomonas mossii]
MAKYTERLAEKIVSLIEEDTFSITEICKHLKITRKSFYEWRDKKPEFRRAIEAAIESRDETLAITARRSLKKKLEGYTLTEIRTTYVPDKENPDKLVLKTRVVRQKEYAPDTHAIRLVLLHNETKEEENKEHSQPLTIIVQDPKTRDSLNELREKLMNNNVPVEKKIEKEEFISEPTEQISDSASLPDTHIEKEKETITQEKEESEYVFIRDYCLPPPHLYRKVKRSEVKEGDIIRPD